MARRSERFAFAGALAALLGAGLLGWWLLLGRGPALTPAPQPPQAPGVVAARADGEAWLHRPGEPRARLLPGAPLKESDEIEAAEGSTVELAAGGLRVTLEGAARFGVREVAAELARFRLVEGVAQADVKPGLGRVLVIESSDDASVETSGGRFSVAAGDGRVAVGVDEGEARLASGGQIVALRAGQFSIAEKGRAPGKPVPLPKSLLLKVEWPEARETNRRRIVIRGRTTPGALVAVGGERVKVRPDGAFTHVLFLSEGQQRIEAAARDASGRRERATSHPVVLDTRAPDTRFDTNNLWGKRRGATTQDKK